MDTATDLLSGSKMEKANWARAALPDTLTRLHVAYPPLPTVLPPGYMRSSQVESSKTIKGLLVCCPMPFGYPAKGSSEIESRFLQSGVYLGHQWTLYIRRTHEVKIFRTSQTFSVFNFQFRSCSKNIVSVAVGLFLVPSGIKTTCAAVTNYSFKRIDLANP